MKKTLCVIAITSLFFNNIFAQIVSDQKGENGLWGFVDANGKWIVEPQYDYANWSKDSNIGTFEKKSISTEAKGCLDEYGKTIVPISNYKFFFRHYITEFDRHYNMTDIYIDYISVTDLSDNVGLVNMKGKLIFPCKYKFFYLSKNGDNNLFIQVTDLIDKKGIYTTEGKQVVPISFDNAFIHDNYITIVNYVDSDTLNGKYSYDGKEIVPCKYKRIMDGNGCFIVTDRNNKKGIYDINGNVIMPSGIYDETTAYSDGLASMKKDGKWGVWGNKKELITCQYDDPVKFENDVATVKKDGEVKLIKNPLKDGSQIQIAENTSTVNNKKQRGPVVSRYPAPDSDVDKNIPVAKKQAENTFAFIIANENYADAPVPYSLNDGRMFREYCQKTLGLPEKNINLYEDATFGNIITAVEKMKSIADAYDGDASVIFYYAGHGFPDDKQQSAYLLPVDGDASNITTTGYSLAKLYKEIAQLKLKSVLVLLDACFSGAKREDQMLASSRGVAIKVKEEAPQGNMVVFSAAQGDETAHQMEENHHGLFTYFLLKELQQTSGDVDLGTLTDYVTKQVKRQSVVINNKKQTPSVIPSADITEMWRQMKLK